MSTPTISFFVNPLTNGVSGEHNINAPAGSGLGFYGNGFGTSVQVNSFQERTFITDGAGTVQGLEARNTKWTAAASAILGQETIGSSTSIAVNKIPNYLSTLNIRFAHPTTQVRTQNAKVIIYDRSSIASKASGVSTFAYEVIHPDPSQLVVGSGSGTWKDVTEVANFLPLRNSPGTSGLNAVGNTTGSGLRHDWYLGLTASPTGIGSKTQYGLYVSLEYL